MSYNYQRVVKSFNLLLVGLLLIGSGLTLASGGVAQAAQTLALALQQIAGSPPGSVPGIMNYQGILRDNQGNVIKSGEYKLTFRIYDVESGGSPLHTEEQSGVIVRDGRFGVTLGYAAPLPAKLFTAGKDRFVGVTVDPYQEMLPRQRLGSVPYAFQAEHAENGVPVGGVIDWWQPDANTPLPNGYLICNGQTVNDPQSPLNGKILPDLRGRFVRGAPNDSSVGGVGGAVNHMHDVVVDLPEFFSTTTEAGAHNHPWGITDNGGDFYSFDQAGTTVLTYNWDNGDDGNGTGNYYIGIGTGYWAYTGNSGSHHHTVGIDPDPLSATTAPGNSLPPYVDLLKLCRVK